MEEDGGIGNSLNMNGPTTITVGNDGGIRINNGSLTINVRGPITFVSPTGQILSGFQPPNPSPPLSHSQPPLIFQQSLPNVADLTQQVQQLLDAQEGNAQEAADEMLNNYLNLLNDHGANHDAIVAGIKISANTRKLSDPEVLYLLKHDTLLVRYPVVPSPVEGLFMYNKAIMKWFRDEHTYKKRHFYDHDVDSAELMYLVSITDDPADANSQITRRRYALVDDQSQKFLVHYLREPVGTEDLVVLEPAV